MTLFRYLSAVLAAVAVVALWALPCRAEASEPSNAVRAQQLFDQARALVSDGKYDAACPLFEQSLQLVEGLGTLFNLADCWERSRKTHSAALTYRRVERLANANGQDRRAEAAARRASALEAAASRLQIRLEDTHTVTEVRSNGALLAPEQLGQPVAVDPGAYQIVASAAGKRSWAARVDVPDAAVIVTVLVPVLDTARATAAAAEEPARSEASTPITAAEPPDVAEHEASASSESEEVSAPPQVSAESPWRRRAALIVAGVGVGGLVASGILAVQYRSSDADARKVCPSGYSCSPREVAQHAQFVTDSRRARTLSFVSAGVGLAALTGAAILRFGGRGSSESTLTASAVWSPHDARAVLQGTF